MIYLSESERGNPMEVIKSILLEVKPIEMDVMIRKALEVCLTTDQSFNKASERYELLSVFNKINRLIEATSLL